MSKIKGHHMTNLPVSLVRNIDCTPLAADVDPGMGGAFTVLHSALHPRRALPCPPAIAAKTRGQHGMARSSTTLTATPSPPPPSLLLIKLKIKLLQSTSHFIYKTKTEIVTCLIAIYKQAIYDNRLKLTSFPRQKPSQRPYDHDELPLS